MKQKTGDLKEFLEHEAWIRRLARSLVLDENRADEVVQQVWLSAIKYKPDTSRNLRPWLAVVARSAAKKLRRSEGRSSRREKVAAKPEEIPSNAAQVDRKDVQESLAQFVRSLEEPYRSLIVQHYFEGKALEAIAKDLGVPSSTVRSRLKRVLAEMRVRLDRQFGDRSLWVTAAIPWIETAAPSLPAPPRVLAAKVSFVKAASMAVIAVSLPCTAALMLWAPSAGDSPQEVSAPVSSSEQVETTFRREQIESAPSTSQTTLPTSNEADGKGARETSTGSSNNANSQPAPKTVKPSNIQKDNRERKPGKLALKEDS